jgi:hypothetical protein
MLSRLSSSLHHPARTVAFGFFPRGRSTRTSSTAMPSANAQTQCPASCTATLELNRIVMAPPLHGPATPLWARRVAVLMRRQFDYKMHPAVNIKM